MKNLWKYPPPAHTKKQAGIRKHTFPACFLLFLHSIFGILINFLSQTQELLILLKILFPIFQVKFIIKIRRIFPWLC